MSNLIFWPTSKGMPSNQDDFETFQTVTLGGHVTNSELWRGRTRSDSQSHDVLDRFDSSGSIPRHGDGDSRN